MITFITRPGIGKDHSEDAVLAGNRVWVDTSASIPFENHSFVCVADGVGGQLRGEAAASFVLSELNALSVDHLRSQILAINDRLIAKGIADPSFAGMATTLTGVYCSESSPTLIHIGNSRAYVMQGNYLKQLTGDHTLYHWLVSTGHYAEAQHCNKNEIIACMGGGSQRYIEKLYVSTIPAAHTLLLTSDGIHDHVEIDELERIMSLDVSDMEKCRTIVDLAIEAGSTDDLTIVVVRTE